MNQPASIPASNGNPSSLRGRSQFGDRKLIWLAILASVILHLASYVALDSGLMQTIDELFSPTTPETKLVEKPFEKLIEIPLVYVEVDPEFATAETPEDTEFYSARNSLAANPDSMIESDTPNIDGEQSDYLKTEDVPVDLSAPQIVQELPSTEPIPNEPPAVETAKISEGNLNDAKPNSVDEVEDLEVPEKNTPATIPTEIVETPDRPRTLLEARMLAGEKSQMVGGVDNRRSVSLVDARGMTIGAYDEPLTHAVQQRWWQILERRGFTYSGSGTVVIKFRLHKDGKITDSKIFSNTIGNFNLGIICISAINDPAPYPEWPEKMIREVGEDWRDLTFTFHYR